MEGNEELFDDFSEESDSNDEVQEEPVICEVEEKQPKPEYSTDELNELIVFLKKIVYLDNLQETDWNDECDKVIRTWFLETSHLMLTIYFTPSKQLKVNLNFPNETVFDLTYFLREPNHIFSLDDFHDRVTFGRIDSDVDGALLLLMEKIYAPILLHKSDWPESNRTQFLASLHSFLANMTSLHYKLVGLTVLYVPIEGLSENVDKAIEDVKLVQRLEMIADHWIVQIRICLCDREQIVANEYICPSEEYEFWVYRSESLLGLQYQVQHKDFQRIFHILQKSQSIFVKPLTELFHKIDNEILQAHDDIRYLELLLEPCKEISTAPSPADIPVRLAKIINIIRYIWLNAKHFNDLDSITKLYRYVGNQIIRFCQSKIQVSDIFSGDATNQVKIANLSVDCCLYYKVIYAKISERETDWKLDESLIFNHIDSFIQRLHDFIEICAGISTFSRKPDNDNNIELKFGGDRGYEFETTCKRIEDNFEQGLKKLEGVSHLILNIGEKTWQKYMVDFRELISHLEGIIDNMIVNIFTCVHNLDEGIYALACLHRFSNRIELRKKFERKVIVIWNLLAEELSQTNDQLIEEYNEYLSYVPAIAGRPNQLKLNRHRIIRLRSIFESGDWLPESIDTDDILTNYNSMIVKMQKSIQKLFDEWIQSLGVEVVTKLNRLILKRSLTHTGLFECNIDQSIFETFNEAHFFKILGFGFPVHVSQFFQKEPLIRTIYDATVEMIASYNRIVLSLSDFERQLLRPLMHASDKCIAQGALKLIWANEGLDTYISDCNKAIRDLNDVVNIYRETNAQIVSGCERLAQIIIVYIANEQPRQLDEVERGIQIYVDERMELVLEEFNKIRGTISVLNEELLTYMEKIQKPWIEYILKMDKLIEEAIRICARNSLQSVYSTLHGNGVLNPNALFHVVLDIKETSLTQEPDFDRIQTCLSSIFERLLKSLSRVPRLIDSFDLHPPEKPVNYFNIISCDPKCLNWRTKIQNEIKLSNEHMQCYARGKWLQYEHLWQPDKSAMVDKFAATAEATATKYDQRIQDLMALSNQVTICELTRKTHFMLVNAANIRKKIRNEIEEWKQLYLESIEQKTVEKTNKFFTYLNENCEKISEPPQSVDELQTFCTIYEQLTGEIERCKCILNELTDQFDVLNKYGITLDDELNELKLALRPQWLDYLSKLNDADEMLNNAKDRFKLTLESKRKTPDFF